MSDTLIYMMTRMERKLSENSHPGTIFTFWGLF